ncbi:hypothetical protein, partial [Cryobacterium sp. M23]|uniref:hypothetical protein n=1 Tax=Cryobacterium sp. M23 TaxID=2048292 RepID=UPI001E646ECA
LPGGLPGGLPGALPGGLPGGLPGALQPRESPILPRIAAGTATLGANGDSRRLSATRAIPQDRRHGPPSTKARRF